MYKWGGIVIQVGSKKYFVYTYSGSYPNPKIVGKVEQTGKVVRVTYSKIERGMYDGEVVATRIVEVKKPAAIQNAANSSVCLFCGTWKYYDKDSQSNSYLKLIDIGSKRIRLVPGFVGVNNQIAWQYSPSDGLDLSNTDGIYLRVVGRTLSGSFRSMNFRATGGSVRPYAITCQLKTNGKMSYSVKSGGFVESYVATKQD